MCHIKNLVGAFVLFGELGQQFVLAIPQFLRQVHIIVMGELKAPHLFPQVFNLCGASFPNFLGAGSLVN